MSLLRSSRLKEDGVLAEESVTAVLTGEGDGEGEGEGTFTTRTLRRLPVLIVLAPLFIVSGEGEGEGTFTTRTL